MSATYVTVTQIPALNPNTSQSAADQLAAFHQAQADMFSTFASIAAQLGIYVVPTSMSVNSDGTLTIVTADPIPTQTDPQGNMGLIRTA